MNGTQDFKWMQLAMRLAVQGLGRTGSNPSVGCVIVRESADGTEVVGRGRTGDGGTLHGEVEALAVAKEDARGATLYVTLEPCSHFGKTPPCADAIIEAGIKRVVCALKDPHHVVAGQGLARLRAAGIEVITDVLADEARWLTLGHIMRVTKKRPFVQMKIATGADGLIAPGNGEAIWVTGEQARAMGHLLRAQADAILVGSGTVLTDDPSLDCRLPGLEAQSPKVYVLDRRVQLPLTSRLVQRADTHEIVVVAARKGCEGECGTEEVAGRVGALMERGVKIFDEPVTDNMFLPDLLSDMVASGNEVTRLLVEGGPHVWRSFLDAGLVDEVVHFCGRRSVGASGIKPFVDEGLERITSGRCFIEVDRRSIGEDKMIVYRNKQSMKAE